jgi:Flp pilus assembly protein TadB
MAEAIANDVMLDDQAVTPHDPGTFRPHRGWWWKTLLAGLVTWVVTVVVTSTTQNLNLVPALILVGGFLVPLCLVRSER